MTPTFRCGHAKTPENVGANGGAATRCKTCQKASTQAQRLANPERFRELGAARTRRHRGGSRGHRNSQKESCPRGHLYVPENTYMFAGTRQCKECRRARATAYYHSKRANGGSHTEAEWQKLCESFGNRCLCCDASDIALTRDHVLPVTLGGGNFIENIQPLCRPCNSGKKDKHIDYRPRVAVPA